MYFFLVPRSLLVHPQPPSSRVVTNGKSVAQESLCSLKFVFYNRMYLASVLMGWDV